MAAMGFDGIGRAVEALEAEDRAEIQRLEAREVMVETNEGTFGAEECCRKVGTGDPKHGNYRVYETVGGARRVVGCDPANAPGYARRMKAADDLPHLRKQLAALRRQLRGQ